MFVLEVNMLKQRVAGVLRPRATGCKAKGITTVILMGALFALMIGCSSIPTAEKGRDPLYGTWENEEYSSGYWVWRFIYQPDGLTTSWDNGKPADEPNTYEGRFTIDKRWIDSKGNTWYRMAERVCIVPYSEDKTRREYGLIKVSADGNILESEWSTVDFPPEFGAHVHYVFYRR
jgi:hypothetical protein